METTDLQPEPFGCRPFTAHVPQTASSRDIHPLRSMNSCHTMPPEEAHADAPVRQSVENPNFSILARSDKGQQRGRQEDAWAVLGPVHWQGQDVTVVAVFDGLGGLPRGRESAWAAADGLMEALSNISKPQELLPWLSRRVSETGGATTAVIALLPNGASPEEDLEAQVISVGDSAAYKVGLNGTPGLINPIDSAGRHVVTDCLGNQEVRGHVSPIRVPPGGSLLLCTDGVDGVVDPETLQDVLRAVDMEPAVEALFGEVYQRGSPDNATAILVRRRLAS